MLRYVGNALLYPSQMSAIGAEHLFESYPCRYHLDEIYKDGKLHTSDGQGL
jgi:hypothetical protein